MKLEKIYTALVTPFNDHKELDLIALEKLIDNLYCQGLRGFVIGGTTGESCTLSNQEKETMVELITQKYQDVSIILGVGNNDTTKSIADITHFNQIDGIDAYLVVVPYYNCPSQEGIYAHFMSLDIASRRPMILYNVPRRCEAELTFETIADLIVSSCHIIGLKQASDDLETVKKLKTLFPEFKVFCGQDECLLESLYAGCDGVISVVTHLIAPSVIEMFHEFETGQNLEPLDDYIKMIAKYCFLEPSPAPVKYLLFKKGLINNVLRLPMSPLSKINEPKYNALAKILDHPSD